MIVVVFHGGFANQLFQYALYLKLIELFPQQRVFADISHYKTCQDHGGFKLDKFTKLEYFKKEKSKYTFEFVNENNYFDTKINEIKNYLFDGYWQDPIYFPKDLSNIFAIFSPQNLNEKNMIFFHDINSLNSVSLHVRRGDYLNHYMHGNIANKAYFQNAIMYIEKQIDKPVFFVFSDDIGWCKNNLDFGSNDIYFVDGNNKSVEQDIILMSSCKYNIISNSSFSWWASYLNQNPDKIIVNPEYWFNQKTDSVKELKVNNSVKIPNTPYVSKENKEPFFSFVIPVYNTSATLRRTLASVLNQTFTNIEVIIVDDGSTDNSFDILKTYEVRDKRIRLFRHKKNSSSLVSRITGVKQAKGKYILFLDSDDWFELNACEKLYNKLLEESVDALEFGYIREPNNYKQPIVKNFGNRFEALLKENYPVTLWNKVYNMNVIKKAIDALIPFYATFAEDAFFSVVIAFYAKTYAYVDEYLYHYSISTGISTQNNYSEEKIDKIIHDVSAVKTNLMEFIVKNAPMYEENARCFMNDRYSFLASLVMLSSNKVLSSKLLIKIDDSFGTSFFENYIQELEDKVQRFENLVNLPFSQKCKFGIKYVIRKILKKMGLIK